MTRNGPPTEAEIQAGLPGQVRSLEPPTPKEAILAALGDDLAAMEKDYHLASSETAQVLAATIAYVEGTQALDSLAALAEVAYAFLAGYEHATADTDATRPVYRALRKAGLSL